MKEGKKESRKERKKEGRREEKERKKGGNKPSSKIRTEVFTRQTEAVATWKKTARECIRNETTARSLTWLVQIGKTGRRTVRSPREEQKT